MPSALTADLERRIETLASEPAYRAWLTVRDEVLNFMAGDSQEVGRPSRYWQEELANFEYMLDASPLIVDRLRQHTFHVTGVRVYDYRSERHAERQRMAAKLAALRRLGGDELLVPESPALGGFGFDIDGRLYNIDTLKFYEVFIALRRGDVLSRLMAPGERRAVWEIGAGWGGFAYQWKTLMPNTTYVITDLPELFLFSAVYLMSQFPGSRVLFHDGSDERQHELERWWEYDFIFSPHTQVDALRLTRLDLALNMVSFQEMTTEQVRQYVERAHELGASNLYSLNRDRSPYNRELGSVGSIIRERFRTEPVSVLPVAYPDMLDSQGRASALLNRIGVRRRSALDYEHLVGASRDT
jgi:hypothetical protein